MAGGVHRIPVEPAAGALYLCGLEAVGPDPVALLDHLQAGTVISLQTETEIRRRYPAFIDWLLAPEPHEAIRLPTEDHLVAADERVLEVTRAIVERMDQRRGVLVHCGAGWGRAGVVAVLVMCAYGAQVDDALRDLRLARPAAGPQSSDQDEQVARLAGRLR